MPLGVPGLRAGARCSFAIVNQVLVRFWACRGVDTDRMGAPALVLPRGVRSGACCVLSDARAFHRLMGAREWPGVRGCRHALDGSHSTVSNGCPDGSHSTVSNG